MKTFYVIRSGWNAANQSSLCRKNPKNRFESNEWNLVAIVQADSAESACGQFDGIVYNNQFLFAVSSPRKVKGLTEAIRNFNAPVY